MLEFANRLVALERKIAIYLPDGERLTCERMPCHAAIRPMPEGLDVVWFNEETQWHLPALFRKTDKRVFYALHYAKLYGKPGSWESIRLVVRTVALTGNERSTRSPADDTSDVRAPSRRREAPSPASWTATPASSRAGPWRVPPQPPGASVSPSRSAWVCTPPSTGCPPKGRLSARWSTYEGLCDRNRELLAHKCINAGPICRCAPPARSSWSANSRSLAPSLARCINTVVEERYG